MRRILYLPIEIIERELDSKLLLAVEALIRGYRVYVGHFRRIESVALSERGGIYLYKAMTDQNGEKLFMPLKEAGVITVALDEEGLVWPSLKYYSDTRIGKGNGLNVLDLIFTWGEEQREHIIRNYGVKEDRIVSTGNPRFDIIKEPYREIYRNEANRIKMQYGTFILVNTNFGPANFSRVFGRTWLEHLTWSKIIKNDNEFAYYKDRECYYSLMLASYVEALKALAKAISPVNIVLRPHPSEEHSTWVNAFKGVQNIRVVFEGSSKPWMMAAKCLIHSGCTTGLEAFAMGVPVIRYNVTGREDMESPLPNLVSEFCASYPDLEKVVRKRLEGSCNCEDDLSRHTYLSRRLSNVGSKLSYKIILDEFDKRFPSTAEVVSSNCGGDLGLIMSKIRAAGSSLEGMFFGLPYVKYSAYAQRARLRRQRFSGLFDSQILGRVKEIIEASGVRVSGEILVKRVAKDVYYLEKTDASSLQAS